MRSAVLLALVLMGRVCLADTNTTIPHQSSQAKPHVIVVWNTDPDEFPTDPLTELAKAVWVYPEARLFHVGQQSNFGGYHEEGYWYDRSSQRLRWIALSWREYGNEHFQSLWSQVTAAKIADLIQPPNDFDEFRLKRAGCKKIGHWYHRDRVRPNNALHPTPPAAITGYLSGGLLGGCRG